MLVILAMGDSKPSNTGSSEESAESVLRNEQTEGSIEGIESVSMVYPKADYREDANDFAEEDL